MSKRVLFCMDEGIGNAILALPAIEAMVNAEYDVSVMGRYPALDIIPENIKAYTLEQLEDVEAFDYLLLSAWSASYKQKYGVKGHKEYATEVFESEKIDGKTHEALLHYDLVSCLEGVDMIKGIEHIQLPKIRMAETEIPDTPYITLCNAAAPLWDRKRWKGYGELSHLLIENLNYKVIVLGGDNDRDYFNPDDFHADVQCEFDLPIEKSVYLLNHAEWIVGNDCGLVHIASALGKQTIALFGATSKIKNEPLGSAIRQGWSPETWTHVLSPLMPCSPCQYEAWESVCNEWECMKVVTPEKVYKYMTCIPAHTNLGVPAHIKPTIKEQKLACVMRVKDAMDTIQECIESIARICDYFVILDNGSTDGTLAYLQGVCNEHQGMFPEGIAEVAGAFDESRDKAILEKMLRATDATWALFLDSDEIVSDQLTREQVEDWMHSHTYNGVRFRHVHFWQDTDHYRIDQRWKPRHNRMMWRITPESTMTTDLQVHSAVVSNLKGKVLDTNYVIKHYGHLDTDKNAARAEHYRQMDNPSMPNWSGRTYKHMVDTDSVILSEWQEDTPIDERAFGNPSLLICAMHAGGDMLMLTPTLAKLKKDRPDLEISVMGLGKTQEKDFRTHQYFENNPNVHKYYDSSITYHPLYWDFGEFNSIDLPFIKRDIDRIQEEHCTRFDDIIIVTLQSHYEQHRIDRFAWACNVALADDEKRMQVYSTDEDWNWAVDVMERINGN